MILIVHLLFITQNNKRCTVRVIKIIYENFCVKVTFQKQTKALLVCCSVVVVISLEQTAKLEARPLSAFHNCLLNIEYFPESIKSPTEQDTSRIRKNQLDATGIDVYSR